VIERFFRSLKEECAWQHSFGQLSRGATGHRPMRLAGYNADAPPGARISQPGQAVSGSTRNLGGLISGEHYNGGVGLQGGGRHRGAWCTPISCRRVDVHERTCHSAGITRGRIAAVRIRILWRRPDQCNRARRAVLVSLRWARGMLKAISLFTGSEASIPPGPASKGWVLDVAVARSNATKAAGCGRFRANRDGRFGGVQGPGLFQGRGGPPRRAPFIKLAHLKDRRG